MVFLSYGTRWNYQNLTKYVKQHLEWILVQVDHKMRFLAFVFTIFFFAICWSFKETIISDLKLIFHYEAKIRHSDNSKAFFLNLEISWEVGFFFWVWLKFLHEISFVAHNCSPQNCSHRYVLKLRSRRTCAFESLLNILAIMLSCTLYMC